MIFRSGSGIWRIGQPGIAAARPGSAALLDGVDNVALAFGLRRLRSDYSGAALRVRRSSDDALEDIGFDASGEFSSAAFSAFVGAGSGYAHTVYGQDAVGINAVQTNAADQPEVILNYKNNYPALHFATGNGMAFTATTLTNWTIIVGVQVPVLNTATVNYILGGVTQGVYYDGSGTGVSGFGELDASSNWRQSSGAPTTFGVTTYQAAKLRRDKVEPAYTQTGTLGALTVNLLGGRNGGSGFGMRGYVTDLIAINAVIDDTTHDAIVDDIITRHDAISTAGSSVYLTFDDGMVGNYTLAYPYMDAAGMAGTAYIVTDWIDTAGYMSPAQLAELDAAGWDIGNHTKAHVDLTTLDLTGQTAALSDAKTALDALGLTGASDHVAYPLGASNADTYTAMANLSMATGRRAGSLGGVVVPVASPYTVPANQYYTGQSAANLQAAITTTLVSGHHYVIYMHDVSLTPTSYDISYAEFTALVDWLVANDIPCKAITELPLA